MNDFAIASKIIMEAYEDQLRESLQWYNQPFFDGTHGPPDPRPFLGPPVPEWVPEGACGSIFCKCCNATRKFWDNHCC